LIDFSELMTAIQKASAHAGQAVADENSRLLKTYFHTETPAARAGEEGGNAEADGMEGLEHLTPRMVVMRYPRETSAGPGEHKVMVPLLSLSPISNIRMSTVKLEMDLEVLESEEGLKVGFPSQKKTFFGGEKTEQNVPNAKVTINLSTDENPPGLKAVIEGYDKALRAQIPS